MSDDAPHEIGYGVAVAFAAVVISTMTLVALDSLPVLWGLVAGFGAFFAVLGAELYLKHRVLAGDPLQRGGAGAFAKRGREPGTAPSHDDETAASGDARPAEG